MLRVDAGAARAAREAACGSAPHHRRQPPRASRASRSPPIRARMRDGRAFIARCDRARRRGGAVGGARLRVGSRLAGAASAGRGPADARSGAIADFIYGIPSRALWMVGVTGTNGKTSCAHWIAQALDACGRRAAVSARSATASSARSRRRRTRRPSARAARDCSRNSARAGAGAVAMEVSSHGLDQGRVNGVEFDVALFTNLTRDHLDYHGTMAAYGAGEGAAVRVAGPARSGVNADDAFGQSLDRRGARTRRARAHLRLSAPPTSPPTQRCTMARQGIATATSTTPWGSGERRRRRWSATSTRRTCSACWACCSRATLRSTRRSRALRACSRRPGRMQRLAAAPTPLVVVDYAHTPDALEKVLAALRRRSGRGRRAALACSAAAATAIPASAREMGAIAATLADRVVVTSDNPRGEDPRAIADAIVARHARRPATAAGRSSSTARAAIREADRRREGGRRRAGRRQGPRGLPGDRRRARAVLRCDRGRRGARGAGAPHDGYGAPPPRAVDGRVARRATSRSDASSPTAARSRPAICSSRSRASASTATTSSPRRSRRAPPRRWSADRARGRAAAATSSPCADPLRRARARSPRTGARGSTMPLVVVVGSNGKTTVKEMLAAILRAHFGDDAVLRDRRQPEQRDRPAAHAAAPARAHRAAVIELGMNHRGETRELAADRAADDRAGQQRAARAPGIHDAAWTRSPPSTRTRSLALPRGGIAVLNADDRARGRLARRRRAPRRGASSTSASTPGRRPRRAARCDADGSDARAAHAAGDVARARLRCPGGTWRAMRSPPPRRRSRRGVRARRDRARARRVPRRSAGGSSARPRDGGRARHRRHLQRQSGLGARGDRRARARAGAALAGAGRHGRGRRAGPGVPSRDRRLRARSAASSACYATGDARRAKRLARSARGAEHFADGRRAGAARRSRTPAPA